MTIGLSSSRTARCGGSRRRKAGRKRKRRKERSSQRERAMNMTVDDKVFAQDLSQMRCAVSSPSVKQCAVCASSTHDVHHAIVGVNVVIGVLVVHCELLVVRVVPLVDVCDEAVDRRTHGLIALVVIVVFVVAIFHRILLYGRYTLYTFTMHMKMMPLEYGLWRTLFLLSYRELRIDSLRRGRSATSSMVFPSRSKLACCFAHRVRSNTQKLSRRTRARLPDGFSTRWNRWD